MEVMQAIENRRSHRAYESTPLTEQETETLLKAAVASPSAVNRQPWHFTLVRDQALLQEIHDATAAEMQAKNPQDRSPRFTNPSFHVFYHAPAVLFISGDPDFPWTQVDCGIAVQNIALAAESMGLGSVILGMPKGAFRTEKAEAFKKALHFPEGYEFVIAIAVGHPADTKDAHEVKPGHISFVG